MYIHYFYWCCQRCFFYSVANLVAVKCYGFYYGANPIFGRTTQRGGVSARYLCADTWHVFAKNIALGQLNS